MKKSNMSRNTQIIGWLVPMMVALGSASPSLANPLCAEIFAPTPRQELSSADALEAVRNGEANPMLFATTELSRSAERIDGATRYLRDEKALTISLDNMTAKKLGKKLDSYQKNIEELEKVSKRQMSRFGRFLNRISLKTRSIEKIAQAANLTRIQAEQLATELERENKLYEGVDTRLIENIKALEAEMNHFDQLIEILHAESNSTENKKWHGAINEHVIPLFAKEAANLRTMLALAEGTRQAIEQRVFVNTSLLQQVRLIRDGALPSLLTTGDPHLRDALDVNRAAAGDANPFCVKADLCTDQRVFLVHSPTYYESVTVEGIQPDGQYVVRKEGYPVEHVKVARESLAITTGGLQYRGFKIGESVVIPEVRKSAARGWSKTEYVGIPDYLAHLKSKNDEFRMEYDIRRAKIVGILPYGQFVLEVDHREKPRALSSGENLLKTTGTLGQYVVGETFALSDRYNYLQKVVAIDPVNNVYIYEEKGYHEGSGYYQMTTADQMVKLSGTLGGFSVGDKVTDKLGNQFFVVGIHLTTSKIQISPTKSRSSLDFVVRNMSPDELRHR